LSRWAAVSDAYRIAIIDEHPIYRAGVVHAILRDKSFQVVAEGTSAEDAKRVVRETEPDVLLLEAGVPGSLDAAEKILQAHPDVKVIFLTSGEDLEFATRAVRAGAHGYMLKEITGPDLLKAIAAVHAGERYISPDLAWRMVTKPVPSAPPPEPAYWQSLSVREQQVLDYTSKGLSNREIARVLGLGLSTIKYYKTLAFRKTGVRNRVEAILAVSKTPKRN